MDGGGLFPSSAPPRLLLDRPDDGLPVVRRIGGSNDAIAGSLNFGVYDRTSGAQLGYARVVTDEAITSGLAPGYKAGSMGRSATVT